MSFQSLDLELTDEGYYRNEFCALNLISTALSPIYRRKEKFEDIKGITRNRKSKKDRHGNSEKKKDKRVRINNDLLNTTQKTKDRALCLDICNDNTSILKIVSISINSKHLRRFVFHDIPILSCL